MCAVADGPAGKGRGISPNLPGANQEPTTAPNDLSVRRGRRQLRPRHAYQRIDRVAPERRSSSRTAQVNSPNRRLEATSHGPPAASVQEWLNHCWAQRWTEKLGLPSNFLNSLSFRFSF